MLIILPLGLTRPLSCKRRAHFLQRDRRHFHPHMIGHREKEAYTHLVRAFSSFANLHTLAHHQHAPKQSLDEEEDS